MVKYHVRVLPFQLSQALKKFRWENRVRRVSFSFSCRDGITYTYPFSQLFPLVQGDLWVMKEYRFSSLPGERVSANSPKTKQ